MAESTQDIRNSLDKGVSVVVPVLNEAGNIRPLIEEIDTVLGRFAIAEIVYVDDGSDDATASELAAATVEFSRLRSVRHRGPAGQSAAIATGVQAAAGPIIVTLDGDGQNDPADTSKMLAVYQRESSADIPLLVAGHRVNRRDSWLKRAASKIANVVRRRVLGDETPDTGCGLKVFDRAVFLDLPRFDHMHRFLPALFIRQGGRVISVPVSHRTRARGTSKYGIFDRLFVGIADLMGVGWLARRPLSPEIEGRNSLDRESS